jgi:DNA segregation ATPase FtsK/SpoIIIE-like protein
MYSLVPAVTQYEIQPAQGVKVSKIVNLHNDIALALAAKDVTAGPILICVTFALTPKSFNVFSSTCPLRCTSALDVAFLG